MNSKAKTYFGHNIRCLRNEMNLPVDKLARRTGINRNTISNWETSSAVAKMNNAATMAKFFDVDINDLIFKKLRYRFVEI